MHINGIEGLHWIGYWADEASCNYPEPRNLVNLDWSVEERQRIAGYLRDGIAAMEYLGTSFCRFNCGIADSKMGAGDLTDGTFVWPEGLAHYVEEHNVGLPPLFLDHVKRNGFEVPSRALQFGSDGVANILEITGGDSIWLDFYKSRKSILGRAG